MALICSIDVHVYVHCAVGFFLTRHSELMLTKRLKDLYHRLLAGPADSPTAIQLLCQVLTNIHAYLVEEELKMIKAEAKCKYETSSLNSLLCHASFWGSVLCIPVLGSYILGTWFRINLLRELLLLVMCVGACITLLGYVNLCIISVSAY